MTELCRDWLCRKEWPTLSRFTIPICWRSVVIVIGSASFQAAAGLGNLNGSPVLLALLAAGCSLPAAVGRFCPMAGSYRSRRARRFLTGILLGSALVLIARAFVLVFTELY